MLYASKIGDITCGKSEQRHNTKPRDSKTLNKAWICAVCTSIRLKPRPRGSWANRLINKPASGNESEGPSPDPCVGLDVTVVVDQQHRRSEQPQCETSFDRGRINLRGAKPVCAAYGA